MQTPRSQAPRLAEPPSGRTIVVGDVHGCASELSALLDKVHFTSGDRLVFVGDIVARGPDSLGVLDLARRTGAILVRGNHEQRLLDWRADPKTPLGRIHAELAAELRPVDWTLMETAPLYLELPEHALVVVHAGIIPGVSLDAQHRSTLLTIRTVKDRTARDRLWGQVYVGPPHIVFGHHAVPGLQLHQWATGLDTGCVYGGRLTALVLAMGEKVARSTETRQIKQLVSERAARVYYEGGGLKRGSM